MGFWSQLDRSELSATRERRDSFRVSFEQMAWWRPDEGRYSRTRILDLSGSGARLRNSGSLALNQSVDLVLALGDGRYLNLKGRVRWVKAQEVGVEFNFCVDRNRLSRWLWSRPETYLAKSA